MQSKTSSDGTIAFERALEAQKRREYVRALELWRQYGATFGDDVLSRFNRAICELHVGDPAKTEDEMRRLESQFAVSVVRKPLPWMAAEVAHFRAAALVRQGKLEEALTHALRSVEIESNSRTHFGLGDVLYDLGRFVEAEQQYRRAIRLAALKDDIRGLKIALSRSLLMQERFDEPIELLHPIADTDNLDAAEAAFELGRGLYFRGLHNDRDIEDIRAARRAFQDSTRLNPANPRTWGALGLCDLEMEQLHLARANLERAVDLGDRSQLIIQSLALACFRDNAFDACIDLLLRFIDELDEDPQSAWELLALAAFKRVDSELIDEAASLYPESPVIGNVVAALCERSDDPVITERAWRDALERWTDDDVIVQNTLRFALEHVNGRLAGDALTVFEREFPMLAKKLPRQLTKAIATGVDAEIAREYRQFADGSLFPLSHELALFSPHNYFDYYTGLQSTRFEEQLALRVDPHRQFTSIGVRPVFLEGQEIDVLYETPDVIKLYEAKLRFDDRGIERAEVLRLVRKREKAAKNRQDATVSVYLVSNATTVENDAIELATSAGVELLRATLPSGWRQQPRWGILDLQSY